MRWKKFLLAAAGSLGISVSLASGASAQSVDLAALQAEADEACSAALEADTIEALEEYLNKYPDVSSACTALATEALNQFVPTNDGPPAGPPAGGDYSG